MAVSLKFLPGSTIRWRDRQYVIVDYVGLDALIAREPGKRNHSTSAAWAAPDLGPRDSFPLARIVGRETGQNMCPKTRVPLTDADQPDLPRLPLFRQQFDGLYKCFQAGRQNGNLPPFLYLRLDGLNCVLSCSLDESPGIFRDDGPAILLVP
jgi:hypothetical protein